MTLQLGTLAATNYSQCFRATQLATGNGLVDVARAEAAAAAAVGVQVAGGRFSRFGRPFCCLLPLLSSCSYFWFWRNSSWPLVKWVRSRPHRPCCHGGQHRGNTHFMPTESAVRAANCSPLCVPATLHRERLLRQQREQRPSCSVSLLLLVSVLADTAGCSYRHKSCR